MRARRQLRPRVLTSPRCPSGRIGIQNCPRIPVLRDLARGGVWLRQVHSGKRRGMDMWATAVLRRDRILELAPTFPACDRIRGAPRCRGPEGTCHIRGIGGLNLKLVQSLRNCLCTLEEVGIYGFAIGYLCVVREAVLVDDAHLFDNRRLARFTRS